MTTAKYDVTTGPVSARIELPADDWLCRALAKGSFYEADLLLALAPHLHPERVAFDVGAHVGNHSRFLAHFGPVAAFEADPRLWPYWQANVAGAPFAADSRLFERAVTAADGALIGAERDSLTGRMAFTAGRPGRTETVTLDTVAQVFGLPVGAIKLDIEGGELDALRGAVRTLTEYRPVLAVEAKTTELHRALRDFLRPFGYVVGRRYCATPTYLFHHKEPTP